MHWLDDLSQHCQSLVKRTGSDGRVIGFCFLLSLLLWVSWWLLKIKFCFCLKVSNRAFILFKLLSFAVITFSREVFANNELCDTWMYLVGTGDWTVDKLLILSLFFEVMPKGSSLEFVCYKSNDYYTLCLKLFQPLVK